MPSQCIPKRIWVQQRQIFWMLCRPTAPASVLLIRRVCKQILRIPGYLGQSSIRGSVYVSGMVSRGKPCFNKYSASYFSSADLAELMWYTCCLTGQVFLPSMSWVIIVVWIGISPNSSEKQLRTKQLRKAKLVVGVPADAPEQEGRTRSILEFVHQASWGLNER